MYVDPAVVRRKVERELATLAARIDQYRARGIWLLGYTFPQLLVAFLATKIKPFPIAPFGVLIDLANYDVEPPSIQFVNPFTRAPLKRSEVPTNFNRFRIPPGAAPVLQLPAGLPPQMAGAVRDELLQSWGPEDPCPFMCLQGVREYHDNPGHSGDSWWLHRSQGAGRLVRLLDLLSRYGTEPMVHFDYEFEIKPTQIRVQVNFEGT